MSDARDAEIARNLVTLEAALYNIARGRDCDYYDSKDRPDPCPCAVCSAKRALDQVKTWRYLGAHQDRVTNGHNPRETKIHKAWSDLVDDRHLSMILDEKTVPAARDWYVATSVVRWLATNVGMTVLEGAGFKYQQWEQDQATRETMQRRKEQDR